nr:MAG TPA: hypothetical protein [Herelleviridae sp.]
MNKIMIISAGSIHTFDKIKEAAEYKFKFGIIYFRLV